MQERQCHDTVDGGAGFGATVGTPSEALFDEAFLLARDARISASHFSSAASLPLLFEELVFRDKTA